MPEMSIDQTLREAAQLLTAAGGASPVAEARILLAAALAVEPAALFTHPDPTPAQLDVFDDLVARRAAGIPVQHLTGSAAFRTVELAVGPGVFIPRPETEVMVGWLLEQLPQLDAQPLVVDLCTGSGAIARALAAEAPQARIHAVELSEEALVWAGRNLAGTDVELHAGDLAEALPELDGQVDAVICNPPYIPLEAWESVAPDVRDHDPALALFSGLDGLDAIRVLAVTAARLLRPGGVLAFEHAEAQHESAPQVLREHGAWTAVRDHRDLTDRDRFVTAVRR